MKQGRRPDAGEQRRPRERLPLGRVWVGPGVWRALAGVGVWLDQYLARHAAGDGGALGRHRRLRGAEPGGKTGRRVSAYALPRGGALWIVGDGDPARTRVVMPERE